VNEDRLPHGYTNRTRFAGGSVEKIYDQFDVAARARRELACLTALHDVFPVATVLEIDLSVPRLCVARVAGAHGQDLIECGNAPDVLRLVGCALFELQQLPPETVSGLDGDGPVIVHGDFGPQNMLFDLAGARVAAILDWESAHRGERIEDLAWCEWIVRMHHPHAVDALDELFDAAQQRPPWPARHQAMVDRVRALVALCEATATPSPWPAWLDATAAWTE
jgi:hypothetical protein